MHRYLEERDAYRAGLDHGRFGKLLTSDFEAAFTPALKDAAGYYEPHEFDAYVAGFRAGFGKETP